MRSFYINSFPPKNNVPKSRRTTTTTKCDALNKPADTHIIRAQIIMYPEKRHPSDDNVSKNNNNKKFEKKNK